MRVHTLLTPVDQSVRGQSGNYVLWMVLNVILPNTQPLSACLVGEGAVNERLSLRTGPISREKCCTA